MQGSRCLKHLVKARERQRKKRGLKRRYHGTLSYKLEAEARSKRLGVARSLRYRQPVADRQQAGSNKRLKELAFGGSARHIAGQLNIILWLTLLINILRTSRANTTLIISA